MSKWISVKDRLPENTSTVIVWIPSQNPLGGYCDLASFGDYVDLDSRVTHWRPLPALPEYSHD
jgi:hypothetical protein